ncbi:cupin domain-containing protein [Pedobacter sp. GR22-6]|uniref:cupin domain-containing protein n=1 Tax=Pedobacter sp. GR22-6 TaxID=3127957 RepID=UPI00307EBE9F
MEDWQELIDSGLLDLYVLGETNAEENLYIEKMSALHPEIQREINEIGIALEKYALNHAIQPDPIIKPFLLATIDYTTRLKAGEPVSLAPTLNEHASAKDYQQWLERPDMVLPADFEDVHARILSYTPEAITAIVWIKEMAPQEVHDQEYERFLILEGTCSIYIEDQIYHLNPGDYLQIPLHSKHHVIVTSEKPCKVILQRVAA